MTDRLRCIVALARLIVIDGLRRHALIGLILFALACASAGLLFFEFIPRDIGRATNDFLFSIYWLTGFIFLLFHAVQVMAWSEEHRGLHIYLARPISRLDYALGVFLGLAALLFTLNCILGGIGWLLLNLVKNLVNSESYFQSLSLGYYLLAGFGLYYIQLIILAVILLFSSAIRGAFPVLLVTLAYYFICSGLPVVRHALKQREISAPDKVLSPLCQGLAALFPDFSRLDFKTLVASADPVPASGYMILSFLQSFLYIVIVLWLACLIYQKRDLQ